MKDLIGRKVRGFKFEDTRYEKFGYCDDMDKYIGKIGVIGRYVDEDKSFSVVFDDDFWYYPAELIEQHLVEEPIDRDVLRQELEKFLNYCERHLLCSITGKTQEFIDEYFEYLDKEGSTKELTLQEIADKFNVPVDKIRIKE
jgi:DNA-directed RNA polymerase sigma subunit (sigma70/sigma32)